MTAEQVLNAFKTWESAAYVFSMADRKESAERDHVTALRETATKALAEYNAEHGVNMAAEYSDKIRGYILTPRIK